MADEVVIDIREQKRQERLEKARQYRKAYYQTHKEIIAQRTREYRAAHPEKIKGYQKKYSERWSDARGEALKQISADIAAVKDHLLEDAQKLEKILSVARPK